MKFSTFHVQVYVTSGINEKYNFYTIWTPLMQISRLNDQNIELLSHIKSFWHSIKEPLINQLVFIFQRLAFGILVLLFIIFLSYVGLDMATGTSFSEAIQNAIPESSEYIRRLLQGDLGLTTAGSETLIPRPVSEVIQERLPRSLGLLGASLLFASVVGVSLGIISAQSLSATFS